MIRAFRAAGLAAAATLLFAGATAANAAEATSEGTAAATTQIPAVQLDAAQDSAFDQLVVRPAPALLVTGGVRTGRYDLTAPVQAAPMPSALPELSGGSLEQLVERHAGAETADEQFECLASAVYYESRGEPLDGQLAVAEVILNRVRSGRFRSTICDVVRQPSQFSFVRRGVIPQAPRSSAPWRRAVAIAHIALNSLHSVTGPQSLFFHATYVRPNWGRPRIAQIGRHIFYR